MLNNDDFAGNPKVQNQPEMPFYRHYIQSFGARIPDALQSSEADGSPIQTNGGKTIETILTLPPEILMNIASRLDVRSRCRTAAVCGLLNNIISKPIVWRDITTVSVLTKSYQRKSTLKCVYKTKVNGYQCSSLAKVEQALTTLLTRSRPKDLVIRNRHGFDEANFRRMLRCLAPLLPASIEKLQLSVWRFDKHCFVLLQALAPSLKTVNLKASHGRCHCVNDDPVDLGWGSHFHRLEVISAGIYRKASYVLHGFEKLPQLRGIQLYRLRPNSDKRARNLIMRWNKAVSPPSMLCTDKFAHLSLLNGRARNTVRTVCVNTTEEDYIRQLVPFFPNMRRVSFLACKYREETERVVSAVRLEFFTQHANASEPTTLTVDVRVEFESEWLENNRQKHGCVTVDTRYWDVFELDECLRCCCSSIGGWCRNVAVDVL